MSMETALCQTQCSDDSVLLQRVVVLHGMREVDRAVSPGDLLITEIRL